MRQRTSVQNTQEKYFGYEWFCIHTDFRIQPNYVHNSYACQGVNNQKFLHKDNNNNNMQEQI